MSRESLAQFRQLVMQDISLQKQLRETPDRQTFFQLMLQLGEERGYEFDASDVEVAMQDSQRAWLMRWL